MEQVVIAKILKPQGVKGELKCKPFSDEEVFSGLQSVVVDEKSYVVKGISYRFGYVYISLAGVEDRNDAEKFRNKEICIDRSVVGDALLVSDLENSSIFDENGTFIGKIISVENYGSTDILNVEEGGGSVIAIPFITDVFTNVDAVNKMIKCNRSLYYSNRVEE